MESHGGYLCQFQNVDAAWIHHLATEALIEEGQSPNDVALLATVLGGPRIIRFAWDAPFSYGRRGARWYMTHHALARLLSVHVNVAVHSYAFDPQQVEQVSTYAEGHQVGGETLYYEDTELPEDVEDEQFFRKLQSKWPLGHLARILGIARGELLRAPRQSTAWIDLSRPIASQPLWDLFPESVQALRHHELYTARER